MTSPEIEDDIRYLGKIQIDINLNNYMPSFTNLNNTRYNYWGDDGEWCDSPLFPQVFRKAGYHVKFLTNQFLPKSLEESTSQQVNEPTSFLGSVGRVRQVGRVGLVRQVRRIRWEETLLNYQKAMVPS